MNMHRTSRTGGILVAALLLLTGCEEPVEPETITLPIREGLPETTVPTPVDPRFPHYEAAIAPQLGNLHIVTERETLQLAQLWASTLSNGQASLQVHALELPPEAMVRWWQAGPTHRVALLKEAMDPEEQAAFETEWGYPPQRIVVAMDPMVVVVRKGNPLVHRGISLAELEAIFSHRPRNDHTPIRKWGAFELGTEWSQRDISAYGQEDGGPLELWFRQQVLHRSDYQPETERVPDSEAVVAKVSRTAGGIGYASLSAFRGPVAPVPVIRATGETPILPTADNLFESLYPLSPGPLYLYINHRPGVALDALQRELVRFVYSQTGQHLAAELGMVPISALHAVSELQRGEISLTPEDVLLATSPSAER
ncbi:PstS family phosphate ABC transporter substrate-binding protein [Thiohalomonas denitrificans]|uniref:Phosphate transport system substrate-binding protein n=1 Tax=Thiohalomonas denitrificans TaxID=415747 RepID=A0A1G5QHG9_9GAMM|nr:substrate-binding domain-containing protein [Thiohalomonas denitrificans]SCZ61244.1 phosphate transport system substrate-binding protein [Thiohalomonas denitrificans]